jgi:glycosyltransferase involved in cell wall biosynthesis
MNELWFLSASGANAYMTELLEAMAEAVADQGVAVRLGVDRYPPFDERDAYVVIPHEFFEVAPDAGSPTPGHLRRTVGLNVEQPGTSWFTTSHHYARQLGAVADIRASAASALRKLGVPAEHVPIGYTPRWDRWHRDEAAERPLDVLYMASIDERRATLVSSYADTLRERSCNLLIAPERPKPAAGASFVTGAPKHELLASARVLLNLHRSGVSGLEWPRVLEAICNGCVVVSERSLDLEPLAAGEHLVTGRADSLALLADHLLDDPERLARLRLAAYDFVRTQLPMSTGAKRLAEIADALASRPLRRMGKEPLSPYVPDSDVVATAGAPDPSSTRAALKQILIEVRETRREVQQLRRAPGDASHGPALSWAASTPAYESARPRVTVGVSLHDYEAEVRDALASVAASEYDDYELLVLDDASTDGSVGAVESFLANHPWLPAALAVHRDNQGLARTRNAITHHARGELVFVLDADNGLYPHALGRLVRALDEDPHATFAYPTIAVRDRDRPAGLLSYHDWDVDLLRITNFIDAMALIRREALLDLGGYWDDPRVVGWEDYDLWCRVGDAGGHGAHVPEILAWYRQTGHSMLSLTELDVSVARSLIAARAPGVFSSPRPLVAS